MLRSMYSGISGMKVNQTKLDVIGNNIANVGTTAFKSSTARFTDMLYQNAGEATSPTSTKGGTNAKQVGLGAQLASINKVMGQGNALSTGRSLDVCIDGDGYMIVGSGITEYGGDDGTVGGNLVDENQGIAAGGSIDILYTRDGNLTLDYQGNLLTADGYRVMGYYLTGEGATEGETTASSITADDNGNPVANFVNADKKPTAIGAIDSTTKLQPLVIPDKVATGVDDAGETVYQPVKQYSIGKDGVIVAVLGDGSRTALGQIAMASFKNPEGLTSVGGNLLQSSSNSGSAIIKTPTGGIGDADANVDNSKGFGDFIQGCLEGSNVDLTEQFTEMITATRSFQAASKMISTGDEILQTITGLMR